MAMKPTPPPHVPGKNDSERFQNALRKVLSVPKIARDTDALTGEENKVSHELGRDSRQGVVHPARTGHA
jgi:hypothetical protein